MRILGIMGVMLAPLLVVAQMPPAPPGFTPPKKSLHTPKATEHINSLGRRMTLRSSAAIPVPPGIYITNITVNGTNVTLKWQGTGTVQVQQSLDLTNWSDVGTAVTGNATTVPQLSVGGLVALRLKTVTASDTPFAISVGGALNDACTAIARDAQGNLAVVGYYGQTMFVQKRSRAGELIWENVVAGSVNPSCVAVDAGGNIFVGGSFIGTVTFGGQASTNRGQQDCFIAKYSPAGDFLWVNAFGSSGADGVCAITAKGSALVACGFFRGAATIDEHAIGSTGLYMSWVSAFDPATGHSTWVRPGNPNPVNASFNFARGLDIDSSGNVFGIGYCAGGQLDFGCGPLLFASAKGYVAKFDSSGVCLWARAYGSDSNNTRFWSGCCATNGDVVVAGDFQSSTDLGGGTITGGSYAVDGFVARFSGLDGSYQKATLFKGNGPSVIDQTLFCTMDGADTLTLVGAVEGSYSSGGQTVASPGLGSPRGFAMRFDPGLNAAWSAMLSSDGYSQIFGAFDAGQPGCYMAGAFSGNAAFVGMPLATHGGSDGCVLHTK